MICLRLGRAHIAIYQHLDSADPTVAADHGTFDYNR